MNEAEARAVEAPDGSGPGLSPFDIDRDPVAAALAAVPRLPHVTLTLGGVVSGTRDGDVPLVFVVRDGRAVEVAVGARAAGIGGEPTVSFRVTAASLLEFRAGRRSIVDVLAGGTVAGAIGPLMAVAGLLESGPWRRALALAPAEADAQARRGEEGSWTPSA